MKPLEITSVGFPSPNNKDLKKIQYKLRHVLYQILDIACRVLYQIDPNIVQPKLEMFCTISISLPQPKILSLCKENLGMFPIASWGQTSPLWDRIPKRD